MKKEQKQKRTVSPIPINPNDLNAIDEILNGYIAYLRRNSQIIPDKIQKIHDLESIHERVAFVRHGGEGMAAMVTRNDIQTIRETMFAFVQIIRRTVPQSYKRDETLKRVNLLRKSLEKYLLLEKRERE